MRPSIAHACAHTCNYILTCVYQYYNSNYVYTYYIIQTWSDKTQLSLLHEPRDGGLHHRCCFHGSQAWMEAPSTSQYVNLKKTQQFHLHDLTLIVIP